MSPEAPDAERPRTVPSRSRGFWRRRAWVQTAVAAGVCYAFLLLLSLTTWSVGDSIGPVSLCEDNLRGLSAPLLRYCRDHKGSLPRRLEDLVPQYVASERAVHCPWHPTAAYYLTTLQDGHPAVQCRAHYSAVVYYWQPAFLRTVRVYYMAWPTLRIGGEVLTIGEAKPLRIVRPIWHDVAPSWDERADMALGPSGSARRYVK